VCMFVYMHGVHVVYMECTLVIFLHAYNLTDVFWVYKPLRHIFRPSPPAVRRVRGLIAPNVEPPTDVGS
jgi:hypothetical protein